ncbi:NADP-dependent oxidoreductase [Parapedomonas caeni]
MAQQVEQVVLVRRPDGNPRPEDFALREARLPELADGQFLLENHYLSMDAGFRQWMSAGSDDNYLGAMPLEAPVMSIVLGTVRASRHPGFTEGQVLLARTAWESWSIADGSDLALPIPVRPGRPLHFYAGSLGLSGFTAHVGFNHICQPKAGETVVVSAAAGAVGTMVGQFARIAGCRTIGITGSADKARWLTDTVGYDAVINYREPGGVAAGLDRLCPDGLDIYFDNVGAETLDAALAHMKEGARIALCGMIAQYGDPANPAAIRQLWQAITKRAMLKGFMFSDHMDLFPDYLRWAEAQVDAGRLHSFDDIHEGIATAAQAFCSLFDGTNQGKVLVRL